LIRGEGKIHVVSSLVSTDDDYTTIDRLYDLQNNYFQSYFSDLAIIQLMRSIVHPGNPNPDKIQALAGTAETATTLIEPGQSLLRAVVDALAPFKTSSAVLRFKNGAFEAFSYVMPALSKTPEHAVYFSERYDVGGKVKLESASVTFGVRKGQPWLHCHAVWIEPDGTRRCGHLLPEDIQVSEAIEASVTVLRGVTFSVEPDAETNFSLFVPVAAHPLSATPLELIPGVATQSIDAPQSTPEHQFSIGQHPALGQHSAQLTQSVYAVRLSPNIDVCDALEKFCQSKQIECATILGGVGSTVGAVFDDGRIVEPFVTEMLISQGSVHTDSNNQSIAEIDINMVDYKGGMSAGRLKRGENPVLVTFELVLAVNEPYPHKVA